MVRFPFPLHSGLPHPLPILIPTISPSEEDQPTETNSYSKFQINITLGGENSFLGHFGERLGWGRKITTPVFLPHPPLLMFSTLKTLPPGIFSFHKVLPAYFLVDFRSEPEIFIFVI